MKWKDAKPGDRLILKGEVWEVSSREGETVTLAHPTLGTRDGQPPPEGEVQKAPEPSTPQRRGEKKLFREPPKMSERDERIVEKARKETARKERVAADNGVAVEAVDQVTVRLTLGGTVIAHLKPSHPPDTPKAEVMDPQTMKNHLHFFHETYPEEDLPLDDLQAIHANAEETLAHTHTVPF